MSDLIAAFFSQKEVNFLLKLLVFHDIQSQFLYKVLNSCSLVEIKDQLPPQCNSA